MRATINNGLNNETAQQTAAAGYNNTDSDAPFKANRAHASSLGGGQAAISVLVGGSTAPGNGDSD